MPIKDSYGNPLTTKSVNACHQYDEGVRHLLASTYGAVEAMRAAVVADPQFALAHGGLARAHMTEADMPAARTSLATAKQLVEMASEREQQHVEATVLLAEGKGAQARKMVERHILNYPRDVLMAQMCTSVFGLIAFSGCAATEAQVLAYTSWLLPHYGDDWWIKCVHAISLCESGQPEKSLDLMEQSLTLHPRNAGGAHFKAHALYEMGQTDDGLNYLNDWLTAYDRRSVLHGHLNWHVALWALALGDTGTVWAKLDGDIGPGVCQGLPINIVTDTAAILYRAEIAGVEVAPERWRVLSEYAAKHFPNPGQSFVDMHSALAHAMAGDAGHLAKLIEKPKGFAADLVAPVARAWQAIAREDWAVALNYLTPVMAQSSRFGGSRAQRDLLEFTYVNVLLKSGRSSEARRMIQMRRAVFSGHVPVAGFADQT